MAQQASIRTTTPGSQQQEQQRETKPNCGKWGKPNRDVGEMMGWAFFTAHRDFVNEID